MRGIPPTVSCTCRVTVLGTTDPVEPAVGDPLQAASATRARSAAGRRNGWFKIETPIGNGDGSRPPRARLRASPPSDQRSNGRTVGDTLTRQSKETGVFLLGYL